MSEERKSTVKIVYIVYEIREGLLKEPEEFYYGQHGYLFNHYGYETMQDAVDAIAANKGSGLVVLPMVERVWE